MASLLLHIRCQNAQVTSSKMVHKKRHYFLTQFSKPFHMIWSVLLRVLAQKSTFWLVEILSQPIKSFHWIVFEGNKKCYTPCERVWKIVLENGVISYIQFCLRSLGRFKRCYYKKWGIVHTWKFLYCCRNRRWRLLFRRLVQVCPIFSIRKSHSSNKKVSTKVDTVFGFLGFQRH